MAKCIKIFFPTLLISILSFNLYGQSEADYLLINTILKQNPKFYEEDSVCFLTYIKPGSKIFNTSDRTSADMIIWYKGAIKRLLNDTLPEFAEMITPEKIKASFVKWKSSRITYKYIIKKPNENFVYKTQPIYLNEELFILIEFFHKPLGGIHIGLYKFDKTTKTVKPLKYRTIKRYGIQFRT